MEEEEEEAGRGGVGSSSGGGGRSDDSSLKQTHLSAASSAAPSCSGPKMLSKSAIEGFRFEMSASVGASAFSGEEGPLEGTFFGGRGGGVPVGKGLVKEGCDGGVAHASDSDRATSIFGSPKDVSRGGPNKAVVSSETGVG